MTKHTFAQKGRSLMLCLLFASGVGATSAIARTIVVDVAPPAQRFEVVPVEHSGYVWVQGYWAWKGGRHVWVPGHSVKARHGYSWSSAHWEERNGHHYFNGGRWDRNH
jgi:hypothetical protein